MRTRNSYLVRSDGGEILFVVAGLPQSLVTQGSVPLYPGTNHLNQEYQ